MEDTKDTNIVKAEQNSPPRARRLSVSDLPSLGHPRLDARNMTLAYRALADPAQDPHAEPTQITDRQRRDAVTLVPTPGATIFNGWNYTAWAAEQVQRATENNTQAFLHLDIMPYEEAWEERVRTLVLLQMLRFMQPELQRMYIWYNDSHELWDLLQERYSKAPDTSSVAKLIEALKSFRLSGTCSMTEYRLYFKWLCDFAAQQSPLVWAQTNAHYDLVAVFLSGLNHERRQAVEDLLRAYAWGPDLDVRTFCASDLYDWLPGMEPFNVVSWPPVRVHMTG